MNLVGYIKLFEDAPSFTLLVFQEDESSQLFVQDIKIDGIKINGFSRLQEGHGIIYGIQDGPSVQVGDKPIYGILESESSFVFSISDNLTTALDLELDTLPLSFQIQFYDVIDDLERKSAARQEFSKKIISTGGIKRAKSYLESSISTAGWRQLLSRLPESVCSEILSTSRLPDLLFYMDGSQKIQFHNLSAINIEEGIVEDVLSDLREEYRIDSEILINFNNSQKTIFSPKFDTEDSFKFDAEIVTKKLHTVLNSYGRQEDRLSICITLFIVYPLMREIVLNYDDRAQSGRMGIEVMSLFSREISGELAADRPVYARLLNVIDYQWRTGDRTEFLISLSNYMFFVDEYIHEHVFSKVQSRVYNMYGKLLRATEELAIGNDIRSELMFPTFDNFVSKPANEWLELFQSMQYKFRVLQQKVYINQQDLDSKH